MYVSQSNVSRGLFDLNETYNLDSVFPRCRILNAKGSKLMNRKFSIWQLGLNVLVCCMVSACSI
jgi:hypothetical protein